MAVAVPADVLLGTCVFSELYWPFGQVKISPLLFRRAPLVGFLKPSRGYEGGVITKRSKLGSCASSLLLLGVCANLRTPSSMPYQLLGVVRGGGRPPHSILNGLRAPPPQGVGGGRRCTHDPAKLLHGRGHPTDTTHLVQGGRFGINVWRVKVTPKRML